MGFRMRRRDVLSGLAATTCIAAGTVGALRSVHDRRRLARLVEVFAPSGSLTGMASSQPARWAPDVGQPISAARLFAQRPELRRLADRSLAVRRHGLRALVRDDLASGRFRLIDGWVVAETELWLMKAAVEVDASSMHERTPDPSI
jgi:hypothetical protein